MMLRRCLARGCKAWRQDGQIFCQRCWFAVPEELRNRIWSLYRTNRGSDEHTAAIREAIEFHRAAAR